MLDLSTYPREGDDIIMFNQKIDPRQGDNLFMFGLRNDLRR